MTIDFTLSDSQQELQKNAQGFAEGVLRPVAETIDRAADGWASFLAGREAYREMARAGFTKLVHPDRVRRRWLLHAGFRDRRGGTDPRRRQRAHDPAGIRARVCSR